MEPRSLQPLDPVLSAPNSGLALAPIAKSRTAAAHDATCMQAEDPSAAAAGSAEELEKDDARAHANPNDTYFA
jgi:hypothetical protein